MNLIHSMMLLTGFCNLNHLQINYNAQYSVNVVLRIVLLYYLGNEQEIIVCTCSVQTVLKKYFWPTVGRLLGHGAPRHWGPAVSTAYLNLYSCLTLYSVGTRQNSWAHFTCPNCTDVCASWMITGLKTQPTLYLQPVLFWFQLLKTTQWHSQSIVSLDPIQSGAVKSIFQH